MLFVCACVFLSLLAGGLGACNAFDPALLEKAVSAAPPDMMQELDSGQCEVSRERCNGRDDDCDGDSDEGADDTCVFEHGNGLCASEGRCVFIACVPGYVDCDHSEDNSCEKLASEIACGACGTDCDDAGQVVVPVDGGDGDGDAGDGDGDGDGDAAIEEQPDSTVPDACVEDSEICDGLDNDCDQDVDEDNACALQQCVDSTPSYRGTDCDQCVCEQCGGLLDLCQRSSNATWSMQCRAVIECVVVNDRAGECGTDGDCYGSGSRPCVGPLNIASGGTSATDASQVTAGCVAGEPPNTACGAAINYRDECTLTLCETECAD